MAKLLHKKEAGSETTMLYNHHWFQTETYRWEWVIVVPFDELFRNWLVWTDYLSTWIAAVNFHISCHYLLSQWSHSLKAEIRYISETFSEFSLLSWIFIMIISIDFLWIFIQHVYSALIASCSRSWRILKYSRQFERVFFAIVQKIINLK